MTGLREDIHKGCNAARCFDPFFVKEKDLVTLREHVRDLSSLGLTSLNSDCITGIIYTELERLIQEVIQCEHEFELVNGAEEYNINVENLNESNGKNKTWQENYSEYGRRIWRW